MTPQAWEAPVLAAPTALDVAGASLFLDLDGTLAPIMARPDQVGPIAGRTALLQALGARLGGRLAVISGRAIGDIDRILAGAVVAVAGVHGLQRRASGGRVIEAHPHPALSALGDDLRSLAATLPGVLIEDKRLSVAVHYRAAPDAGKRLAALARRMAAEHGLTLQAGDMVIELRTPGQDKGDAIAAFMDEPPFSGSRPVFVGDDLTDESGFAAAARLGGYGVLVGPARETKAARRLRDPAAVLDWLGQAVLMEARS